PALLTFFISVFVPESQRWLHEKDRGATSNWAARDLLGVAVGVIGALAIIYLWAPGPDLPLWVRVAGTALALAVVTTGCIYPILRFLQRAQAAAVGSAAESSATIRQMLLGAGLSGVALLGTWASVQMAPSWADKLTRGEVPEAKAFTQISMSIGA